ncbi:MAG: LPS export ABC transporter periplasmic protein LptC, partial [Armatimonadota bacterium]
MSVIWSMRQLGTGSWPVWRLCGVVALGLLVACGQGCRRRADTGAPNAGTPSAQAPGTGSDRDEGRGAEPLAGARAEIELGEIIVADPEGRRAWRASADVIEWDHDTQQAVLRDVQCVFVEDDRPTLEAKAPTVVADMGERRVVLEGGVVARSRVTRTSLRADKVEWKADEEEVYA